MSLYCFAHAQVAELKAIHQQAAVGGGGPIAAPSAFAAAAAASDVNGGLNKRNGASEPTVTRAGGLTGEQVCVNNTTIYICV
jgi:hypothetical protein